MKNNNQAKMKNNKMNNTTKAKIKNNTIKAKMKNNPIKAKMKNKKTPMSALKIYLPQIYQKFENFILIDFFFFANFF